jgi:hypothetical protein
MTPMTQALAKTAWPKWVRTDVFVPIRLRRLLPPSATEHAISPNDRNVPASDLSTCSKTHELLAQTCACNRPTLVYLPIDASGKSPEKVEASQLYLPFECLEMPVYASSYDVRCIAHRTGH